MRRNSIHFLLVAALGLSTTLLLPAQEKRSDTAAANAPKSGYRAEFLEDVAYYEQRYARLAEAMPSRSIPGGPRKGFAPSAKSIRTLSWLTMELPGPSEPLFQPVSTRRPCQPCQVTKQRSCQR